MEKLAIDTNAGKAKVVGTVMGIGGAMLFTFYKGIEINIWSTHFDLHSQPNSHEASISHKSSGSLLLGSMVSLGSCVSYAIWLIIQVSFFILYFHFIILLYHNYCYQSSSNIVFSFIVFLSLNNLLVMYLFQFISAGKTKQEIPLPLLKYGSNVPDGINSICSVCPLLGEGLEPVEVGLGY